MIQKSNLKNPKKYVYQMIRGDSNDQMISNDSQNTSYSERNILALNACYVFIFNQNDTNREHVCYLPAILTVNITRSNSTNLFPCTHIYKHDSSCFIKTRFCLFFPVC